MFTTDFFSWLETPKFAKTNDIMKEDEETSGIQEVSVSESEGMPIKSTKDVESHKTEKCKEESFEKNADSELRKQEAGPTSSPSSESEHNSDNNDDISSENQNSYQSEEFSDELEQMLVTSAKSLGNFLYNTASSAVRIVSETSTKVKESIEESLVFREFNREQQMFQKTNSSRKMETSLPWEDCKNGEAIKRACLHLSKEQRNFLHDPPPNSDFKFEYETSYPVAMAIMDEDPCLEMMRYELVPKKIKEETFWRNYFYRVNLIRKNALENPSSESPRREYKQRKVPGKQAVKNNDETKAARNDDETKLSDFDWVSEIDNEISTCEDNNQTPQDIHLEEEIDKILQEIDNIS